MAEVFSNFLVTKSMTPNSEQILVPIAGNTSSTNVIGTRPVGSTTQLHSIYITKTQTTPSTDPEADGVYVSLYIKDIDSTKYFIANNVKIVPHSSFYIEKTITLMDHQSLYLTYSNLNQTNATISAVCSGVNLT